MTGLKTLSELDILRLAASELNRKLSFYLDKAEKDPAWNTYIEAIDEELQELYDAMEELEKKEERA